MVVMSADEIRRTKDATCREIFSLRVFVVGGGFPYTKMFFDAGFKGARNVEEADIICFTGGSDVNPALYNETPLNCVHFDARRDDNESRIYGEALGLKKPMIGICRGSQFLTVMNGGTLWQDINNHAGSGHDIIDMKSGEIITGMTSTHHQQMRPPLGAEILAIATRSTRKECQSERIQRLVPENDDIEAVWYPDSLCLCFQPHPEFNHGNCRDYFLDLVDNYILPAC